MCLYQENHLIRSMDLATCHVSTIGGSPDRDFGDADGEKLRAWARGIEDEGRPVWRMLWCHLLSYDVS